MTISQNESRQPLRMTTNSKSGGHGIRTRNRLPGTSFPVHRLPANRLRMVLEKQMGVASRC